MKKSTLISRHGVVSKPGASGSSGGGAGIYEIASGTYSAGSFGNIVDSAFPQSNINGRMTIRPPAGGTVIVNGNYGMQDGVTFENIIFDGQLLQAELGVTGKFNWGMKNCEVRNFYRGIGGDAQHSQGLAIWGGNNGVVIDGCWFHDTGTTSHIWMSYFGWGPDASYWYDPQYYPRNICVKNCRFGPTYGAYFAVHYAEADIPVSANIRLEPLTNWIDYSEPLLPEQRIPELFFSSKFTGACGS